MWGYGGLRFAGTVDRRIEARGKLISPGFVNCHLHAATNAGQAVFLDGLKTDYFGSNFIGDAAPRRGAPAPRAGDRAVGGQANYSYARRCAPGSTAGTAACARAEAP